MRRSISYFIILVLLFLCVDNNVYAKGNNNNGIVIDDFDYVDNSLYSYSYNYTTNNNICISYEIYNKDDIDDSYIFDLRLNIKNGYLNEFSFKIFNKEYKYNYNDGKGFMTFYYLFDTDSDYDIKYNNIIYDYEFEYIDKYVNELDIGFIKLINIKYDNDDIYKRIDSINKLYPSSFLDDYDYYLYESNIDFNNIKIGNYYINYFYCLEEEYYILDYKIHIYDNNDVLHVDDITISYDEPITLDYIINNLVHHLDNDFIVDEYKIDYLKSVNKIGVYEYSILTYSKIYGYHNDKGIISVIDNNNPVINYMNILYHNQDEMLDIEDIFKDLNAYDDYDGDITNKINIIDLDDYENNKNNIGEYKFKLEVLDSSNNYGKLEVLLYIVENIKDDKIELIDEDIDDCMDIIYTDTSNYLRRDDIKYILVDRGYYNEDDNLAIISDYFNNMDKCGEYEIKIYSDDSDKVFNLVVSEGKDEIINENNKKKKNNKLKIIIPISLFLSIMIILVILFIIYRKRRFIEIKK